MFFTGFSSLAIRSLAAWVSPKMCLQHGTLLHLEKMISEQKASLQDGSHSLLRPNLGSDVPSPSFVYHTDQPWYNGRWHYAAWEYQEGGSSGTIVEATYHRESLKTMEFVLGC